VLLQDLLLHDGSGGVAETRLSCALRLLAATSGTWFCWRLDYQVPELLDDVLMIPIVC